MAGITDRSIIRLVDEGVLPSILVVPDRDLRLAPLAAVFARFYLGERGNLTRSARIRVTMTLIDRLRERSDFEVFLVLSERLEHTQFEWSVSTGPITVFLASYAKATLAQAVHLRQAVRDIKEDPDVLGGTPCFKNTRVPIVNVLVAMAEGRSFEELHSAYPFLTPSLIEHAITYTAARPHAPPLRRVDNTYPNAKLVSSKLVANPSKKDRGS
ncbi:DUF433 domain-containing protein [Ralstonia wenshanensis]|uniref:DUF433 domain-containing protein n=1 Tax=Ralstonia wenshanensis TaxID=2842456 RepID=UPI001E42B637|nr:DUF433 domain-containing protein [Ralstonia wenshanensis]UGS91262.1 DUF433 domain-containing protein [Ralstonia wenshanensis]